MPTYVLIWVLSIILVVMLFSEHLDDDNDGPGGGTMIPITNPIN